MSPESIHTWHHGKFLPHTDATGRPQMITFGLYDMLPRRVFTEHLSRIKDPSERWVFIERYMDQGYGNCWLKLPEIGELMAQTLKFYDGRDYRLIEWVIMPNHVHVVYEKPRVPISDIVRNWKSYSATMSNRVLNRVGEPFWRYDYFDRYARCPRHLTNMMNYTLLNPVRAGLVNDPSAWPYSSAQERGESYKEELRRWYRRYRKDFWRSIDSKNKT